MNLKLRGELTSDERVSAQVFVGKDRDHLQLVGTLVLDRTEWDLVAATLLVGSKRMEGRLDAEVEGTTELGLSPAVLAYRYVAPRRFGPKQAGHPSTGERCPACGKTFAEGDYTTLIAIGPGDDPEAQLRAMAGRPYNAVAVEAHWSCVTGEP